MAGERSEATGAASVGGASRALGTALGALPGRVQPERCHVPAPLQRKASKGSRLGLGQETALQGSVQKPGTCPVPQPLTPFLVFLPLCGQ